MRGRLWALRVVWMAALGVIGGDVALLGVWITGLIERGPSFPRDLAMAAFAALLSVWIVMDLWPLVVANSFRIRSLKLAASIRVNELQNSVIMAARLKDECEELKGLAGAAVGSEKERMLEELDRRERFTWQFVDELEPKMNAATEMVKQSNLAAERALNLEKRTMSARFLTFLRARKETAPTRLTSFAAALAGRRRRSLHDEWLADLAGAPEAGIVPTERQRLALARGNVVAALKMRGHDLGAPLWRPVEWVVSAERRTNTFVTLVVGSGSIYFDVTEGLRVLLLDRSAPLAILGGGLYSLAKWARRLRGIELAAPPPAGDEE